MNIIRGFVKMVIKVAVPTIIITAIINKVIIANSDPGLYPSEHLENDYQYDAESAVECGECATVDEYYKKNRRWWINEEINK